MGTQGLKFSTQGVKFNTQGVKFGTQGVKVGTQGVNCFFPSQILEEYNESHKPMNLVLFDDALEHLTRIHRVIRMDQGHALLVGVGGSGRQSLARLAAYAAGCEVFEITLSRGYGEEEFREDLKQLYNKLGIENKKVSHCSTTGIHCASIGLSLVPSLSARKGWVRG